VKAQIGEDADRDPATLLTHACSGFDEDAGPCAMPEAADLVQGHQSAPVRY